MDLGLRKAWVEELRGRFAGRRVKITRGNYMNVTVGSAGKLTEVFLTGGRGGVGADDEIRICVLMDGDTGTTQYRVHCTKEWNENEIVWDRGRSGKSFIAKTLDGEVKFELDNTSPFTSKITVEGIREVARRQSLRRKGLAPGLQLVSLQGRKGVAPALRN